MDKGETFGAEREDECRWQWAVYQSGRPLIGSYTLLGSICDRKMEIADSRDERTPVEHQVFPLSAYR